MDVCKSSYLSPKDVREELRFLHDPAIPGGLVVTATANAQEGAYHYGPPLAIINMSRTRIAVFSRRIEPAKCHIDDLHDIQDTCERVTVEVGLLVRTARIGINQRCRSTECDIDGRDDILRIADYRIANRIVVAIASATRATGAIPESDTHLVAGR